MNRILAIGATALGVAVLGTVLGIQYSHMNTSSEDTTAKNTTSDGQQITGPFSTGSRVVYASPLELIKSADLIASATFVDESEFEVAIPSAVDGASHASRKDVVRRFRVVEVLKGDTAVAGDEISAIVTTSNSFPMPNGQTATVAAEHPVLEPGAVYVVFLKRTASSLAKSPWSFFGEPEVASLIGDDVKFLITPGYRKELLERGGAVDGNALGGEFSLKLANLRDLVLR